MIDALQGLVERLENDPSFFEPNRLHERLEALNFLDAYVSDAPRRVFGDELYAEELNGRARAIYARLEAANCELYGAIRNEIQRGIRPEALLQWASSAKIVDTPGPLNGVGYDDLDELISGIFQFEEPDEGSVKREPEKVFYQPTPARHIFSLIGQTALTEEDVLVDLGSGLGHVPLLVSICTPARSLGIELEATYVERAQECAQNLRSESRHVFSPGCPRGGSIRWHSLLPVHAFYGVCSARGGHSSEKRGGDSANSNLHLRSLHVRRGSRDLA